MNKLLLGATALVSVIAAAPASADITFNLFNVSLLTPAGGPAGTLTGSFTTNNTRTTVTGYNIVASAFGSFGGYTYTSANSGVTATILPTQYFQLDSAGSANELRLYFTAPLTNAGATLNSTFSYEFETSGGSRSASGSVVAATAAVPEPATWSLMLLGFGTLGYAMRRRGMARARVRFG